MTRNLSYIMQNSNRDLSKTIMREGLIIETLHNPLKLKSSITFNEKEFTANGILMQGTLKMNRLTGIAQINHYSISN